MTRRADPLPASQASPPKARPRAVPQTSDLLAKLVRPTKPTRVPELDRIERLISSHTHYHLGYSGETIPAQTIANELKRVQTIVDEKQRQEASAALARTFKVLAGVPEHLSRMAVIEQAMEAHEAQATPAMGPPSCKASSMTLGRSIGRPCLTQPGSKRRSKRSSDLRE